MKRDMVIRDMVIRDMVKRDLLEPIQKKIPSPR
jgi:hypothetical protein